MRLTGPRIGRRLRLLRLRVGHPRACKCRHSPMSVHHRAPTAGERSKRRANRISRTNAGIEKTTVNAIPAYMALISSHPYGTMSTKKGVDDSLRQQVVAERRRRGRKSRRCCRSLETGEGGTVGAEDQGGVETGRRQPSRYQFSVRSRPWPRCRPRRQRRRRNCRFRPRRSCWCRRRMRSQTHRSGPRRSCCRRWRSQCPPGPAMANAVLST